MGKIIRFTVIAILSFASAAVVAASGSEYDINLAGLGFFSGLVTGCSAVTGYQLGLMEGKDDIDEKEVLCEAAAALCGSGLAGLAFGFLA